MVRCILAIVAVFIAWFALDFLIHGVMLSPTCEATAEFWRPPNETKEGLMMIVTGIAAIAFTSIYCCLVDRKEHLDGTTARTAVWGRHGDRDGIRHVLLHADSVPIGLVMVFGDLVSKC